MTASWGEPFSWAVLEEATSCRYNGLDQLHTCVARVKCTASYMAKLDATHVGFRLLAALSAPDVPPRHSAGDGVLAQLPLRHP